MEHQCIDLSEQAFILINGPLIFLNLTANIFYACCLISPRNTHRLKQPLKMLLGLLVWCSVIYCVSLVSVYLWLRERKSFEMITALRDIVQYYVYSSLTCSVWLSFYYFVQIVPAQRALLIWIKRNIKSVIYKTLLFDGTFLFFCSAIITANAVYKTSELTFINSTMTGYRKDGLYITSQVCIFVATLHALLHLFIMVASSFSTVSYLYRHIRSVTWSGGCFSTPRIQSQIRVTITGISQGVLFFLYVIFCLFASFSHILSLPIMLGAWVCFTCTSLYMLGTTVNLGIGQAIFRHRAANVWKALKALCSAGIVTDDEKMRPASSEMTNTVTADVQMSM